MKNIYSLFTFLLLFTLFFSCKKDNSAPLPENTTDIFIKVSDSHVRETVKLLNNHLLPQITNLSNSELVIELTPAMEYQIQEGDIIVADVSDKFPNGTLRKTDKIIVGGTTITIKTSQATLNDVFKYGRIDIKEPLADTINSQANARTTVSIGPRMQVKYFYDKDKNPVTQNDQVAISATGVMVPNLIFEWEKIEGASSPNHVKMELENNLQVGVYISANIDQVDLGKQLLNLWKYKPVSKVIYGVPIVLTPELRMYTDLSISIPVEALFGFGVAQKLSSGFQYSGDAWKFISSDELVPAFIAPQSIKNSFTASGTVLHFELTTTPYGNDDMKTTIGTKFDAENNFDCATKSFNIDLHSKADFSIKSQFSLFTGFENRQDIREEINLHTKNLKSGTVPCSGGI